MNFIYAYGLVHLLFLEMFINQFWGDQDENLKLDNQQPAHTARMCRLAWPYTSGKD